ncbi:hypothetical protein BT63DRAFT_453955 [Microthyrium microscopicum]|uniref:Uncharacterized protein n=1 Tax=Microthyrium microscopicum TaxID=703497 RepID=A0A6A6UBX5_9PEZI|nr:hypothetical protein BT63DRAFT_453955 [Microthyrium microscopicum]
MAQENLPQTPAPVVSVRKGVVEDMQPAPREPMSMRPQPAQTPVGGLRGGGDRGGACPGRFCFCVPCPIPCDFCII